MADLVLRPGKQRPSMLIRPHSPSHLDQVGTDPPTTAVAQTSSIKPQTRARLQGHELRATQD